MESMGVGEWIAIVVAVGVVGILLGYWLGTKFGGHNTEPMRKLNSEHKEYKDDVREHFEQVSATMTRMVEDYREMYHHVAQGAEKLADMHHETVITPPPKPEAITRQSPPVDGEANARAEDRATSTDKESIMSHSSRTGTKPQTSSSKETPWENAAHEDTRAGGGEATSKSSGTPNGQPTASQGKTLDDDKQAAGSKQPSDLDRPQDAAIRAAAEDAAHDKKR